MRCTALGAHGACRIMASGAQADIWGMTLHLLANATAEWISLWMALGILGKAMGNERSDR